MEWVSVRLVLDVRASGGEGTRWVAGTRPCGSIVAETLAAEGERLWWAGVGQPLSGKEPLRSMRGSVPSFEPGIVRGWLA